MLRGLEVAFKLPTPRSLLSCLSWDCAAEVVSPSGSCLGSGLVVPWMLTFFAPRLPRLHRSLCHTACTELLTQAEPAKEVAGLRSHARQRRNSP